MTPLRARSRTYTLMCLALLGVSLPSLAAAQPPPPAAAPAPPAAQPAPPPSAATNPSERADELYAQAVQAGESGQWQQDKIDWKVRKPEQNRGT